MKKIIFYLLLFKKAFYLMIYPFFMAKGKLFNIIRLNIENYLIFQPSRFRAVRVDRRLLKKFKPQRFVNLEGIRLYGWYIEPKEDRPVILFFHGQAESILSYQDVALFASENGFGLFLLSYRGHYKSWGQPTEKGIYNDAQTALQQLKMLGIDEHRVVLWGHSLGSAVAVETALHSNAKAVILHSPIRDIKTAVRDVWSFFCKKKKLVLSKFLGLCHIKNVDFIQKFDNYSKIKNVKCPILLVHPRNDRVAPAVNSIDIASRNKNTEVFLSDKGNHWNVNWALPRILEFLNNLSDTNL